MAEVIEVLLLACSGYWAAINLTTQRVHAETVCTIPSAATSTAEAGRSDWALWFAQGTQSR
jgi:hypothetical protein